MLGRDEELVALTRVLRQAREGTAAALALNGPAGIGKTTLLDAAWSMADGFERVRIAGHEAESSLGWSGLASLLVAWPALSGPPLALLQDVVRGANHGTVAVGSALHSLVTLRSMQSPVLLVIDDAQWIDQPTADALAFALHRFAADHVAVLIAQRTDQPTRFAHVATIRVDGLDGSKCRALIASRFSMPAVVADRCIELTGGNPLALLHVCEALPPDQRAGQRPIDAVAALPERLGAAFAAKLSVLPAATLRALAVLAVGGDGAQLAESLAGLEASAADLLAAERAGIVSLDGRPRFEHPLWIAAVLDHVGADMRRRAHRALAVTAGDPDRAALHRAAGAEQPDERIACELEGLATRCARRGLPAMAARAWMDAARLSERADARRCREVAAAEAFWDASMPRAASQILDQTIPALADPRERAEAVLLRNQIRAFTEDARGAALELRAEAERVRGVVADLEFPLLAAATIGALLAADLSLGLELSARALARAQDDDERNAARALCGYAAVHAGDGSDLDAILMMESFGEVPPANVPDDQIELFQLAGYVLLVRERWGDAERVLRDGISDATRRGFASIAAFSSALLAELEYRRGRWLDALTVATVDIVLSESLAENRASLGHAVAAHVLAHLGDASACESRARRALESSERTGLASIAAYARSALGASALAQGDAAGAARELREVWEIRLRGGVAEPGVVWYQGDFIEALIAENRRDEATEVVREVARNANSTGRAWSAAVAARGRALLGRGSVRDAIAAATRLGAPFELARTRLALVEHARCDARTAGIAEALATFERLGARPWAVRARAVLGEFGDPAPSIAQQLTDAELRVALLVGRGATNAAVGEQLVISVRTVDAHLRAIFRKLGIKRRSELVLRIATEGGL